MLDGRVVCGTFQDEAPPPPPPPGLSSCSQGQQWVPRGPPALVLIVAASHRTPVVLGNCLLHSTHCGQKRVAVGAWHSINESQRGTRWKHPGPTLRVHGMCFRKERLYSVSLPLLRGSWIFQITLYLAQGLCLSSPWTALWSRAVHSSLLWLCYRANDPCATCSGVWGFGGPGEHGGHFSAASQLPRL